MKTIYDNTFLNSLFTSDEFEFIKKLDTNNDEFSEILESENRIRDLIVNLISGLNESIKHSEINNKDHSSDSNMLAETQKIFEIVNNNISTLQVNAEISSNINKRIIDLLIKIESDSEGDISESKYTDEITSLKAKISDYGNISQDMRNMILQNDSAIQNFLHNQEVKNYLKSYSIEYANVIQEEPKEEIRNVSETTTVVPQEFKENNNCLLISEIKKRVYLPYSKDEILEYLSKYPNQYSSFKDVVNQEFIYPIKYYLKHPVVSRFRETYALIRDREAKSILDAFKFAMDVMFNYNLNPAIIAACKSQSQLENYLDCLSNQKLNEFKDFEIKYEIAPFKVKNNKNNF